MMAALREIQCAFLASTHSAGTVINRNSVAASAYAFDIGADYVTLDGFRMTGGNRGASCTGAGVVIQNALVYSNSLYGISITGTGSTVNNCRLYNNGYGLYIGSGSSATPYPAAMNNVIYSNTQNGINCYYYETLLNNTIAGNGGNEIEIVSGGGIGSFKNNIVWEKTSGQVCISGSVPSMSDYNDLYASAGAYIGSSNPTLGEWRASTGKDANSISKNPLFVNEAGADYHLMSTSGSWHGGAWTADAQSSLCIDSGDPASSYANETAPNGSRINMGAYGNTAEASRAPAERFLVLMEPVGGENWFTGNRSIRWRRQGTGWIGDETLSIEYSSNNGGTWTQLTNTTAVSAGVYVWNVDGLSPWPLYKVRITCVQDASANDIGNFFRIGPTIKYYVNDLSTANDVYCTAVGNDANDGLAASKPKATIQAILGTYDLEGTDEIYVDTGNYVLASNITIGPKDGGTAGNPVRIHASTHSAGTVINRNNTSSSSYAFDISGSYVALDGFRMTGGYAGASCSGVGVIIQNALAYGNSTYGIYAIGTGSVINNCRLYNNGTGLYIGTSSSATPYPAATRNVIYSNTQNGIYCHYYETIVGNTIAGNGGNEIEIINGGGNGSFENNIIWEKTSGQICISGSVPTISDFNNLYASAGASIGTSKPTLGEWRSATGKDANSISENPFFVNEAGADYHPMSTAGSWHGGAWLPDAQSSICIDSGDPASAYINETPPNGSRINLGAYGNTAEGSRTPAEKILVLLEPAGGENWFSGNRSIRWRRQGAGWTGSETVLIEYSSNGGSTWTEVTNPLSAALGAYSWNVNGLVASSLYKIRITCVQDASATDISNPFRIGATIAYYVNDSSAVNDMYCTAVGNDANDGLTSATPKATLQAILSLYDLEPSDTVYVDTGNYILTSNIAIGATDGGVAGNPVRFLASTHSAGTVINRNNTTASSYAFDITGSYVTFDGFRMTGGNRGANCTGTGVVIQDALAYGNSNYGICAIGTGCVINNCRLYGNGYGLYIGNNSTTTPYATATNNVIYSNALNGIYYYYYATVHNNTITGNGANEVQMNINAFGSFKNNIVCEQTPGQICISGNAPSISDYNDLYALSGALVGTGSATLTEWRAATGKDLNSIADDPLFADAAANDYHLVAPSPCIDTAASSSAPATDMDRVARPFDVPGIGFDGGLPYDIGADELAPPTAPSDVHVIDNSGYTIQWGWQDNSLDETGFKIYFEAGTSAPSTVTTSTLADATDWTATGLSVNAQYAFRVGAYNTAGDGVKSSTLTTWTLASTPLAPALGLSNQNAVPVSIQPGDGNPAYTEYAIYCANSGKYVQSDGTLGAAPVWSTASSWGIKNVVDMDPGVVFTFQVMARNGGLVQTDLGPEASDAFSYTLSYTAGSNGSIQGDISQRVDYGMIGSPVTAVPDSGYQFAQWSDGSRANPRIDTNVKTDIAVMASFALTTHTLTYMSDPNGSILGNASQKVVYETNGTTVTAMPNTGYYFVQWSDGSKANPRQDTNVKTDIAVMASFAITTHTLTYMADPNGSILGNASQQVDYDTNGTTVTAMPNTGYYFVQWSDGSKANPRQDTNVKADIAVMASFAITTHTLTYMADPNGSILGNASQTVDYDTNGTTVTAMPTAGYYFIQWSDGSKANPRQDINVKADITVMADFAITTFTLTYLSDPNGSIIGPASQKVDYDTNSTTVTAMPNTGYNFVQWSDGSKMNPRQDTNVKTDISVMASFALTTHTLTYSADPNGSIIGQASQVIDYGANGTTVTAAPDTGYHFAQWSDGSKANPRQDISVMDDIAFTANFAINTYALTYSAGENGSIAGEATQTITHGASGTPVTAIPSPPTLFASSTSSEMSATYYGFDKWSDGYTTAATRIDTDVTSSITAEASFSSCALAFRTDGTSGAWLSGTLSPTLDGSSMIIAHAPKGYLLAHWTKWTKQGGEALYSHNATLTVDRVTEDTTLTAVFVPAKPAEAKGWELYDSR